MRRSLTLITTAILVAGATLTGSAGAQDRQDRQDRSHHTGLPANQVSDQVDARSARIRADLRLTPEQENNWAGFEGAMRDISKKQAAREATLRADRAQQKGSLDVIEQMRRGTDSMTEHAVDQKKLADAAQPLFASLNDQQKRRLSEVLVRFGNEPGFN
jgi:LTXXQ motif family protein